MKHLCPDMASAASVTIINKKYQTVQTKWQDHYRPYKAHNHCIPYKCMTDWRVSCKLQYMSMHAARFDASSLLALSYLCCLLDLCLGNESQAWCYNCCDNCVFWWFLVRIIKFYVFSCESCCICATRRIHVLRLPFATYYYKICNSCASC
jgi:hypothetical protein